MAPQTQVPFQCVICGEPCTTHTMTAIGELYCCMPGCEPVAAIKAELDAERECPFCGVPLEADTPAVHRSCDEHRERFSEDTHPDQLEREQRTDWESSRGIS